MKKIYHSIIVLLLLSLILTSCAGGKTSEGGTSEKGSEEIALTESNIQQYLNIKATYEHQKDGIGNVKISTYSTAPGSFKNVTLKISIKLASPWGVSVTDPAYDDSSSYLKTTITLPANGSHEELHEIVAAYKSGTKYTGSLNISIVSVSGTFVPAQ